MTAVGYTSGDERKLDVAGGTMTGPLILDGDPTEDLEAATKQYVDDQIGVDTSDFVEKAGGTMTGTLVLHADPSSDLHAATKQYVDDEVATALPLSGGTLTGALTLSGGPTLSLHAATKAYVDGATGGGEIDADNITSGTVDYDRLPVGTAADTIAAGDDSRITGAAQKASNLSDLANAATARTNLGLGGAAVLSVGTTAGTVAAGNDSRLTDTRTPTDATVTDAKIAASKLSPSSLTVAHFTPADHGFICWSIDPAFASSGSEVSGTGVLQLIKLKVPVAATVTSICVRVTTAGTSLSNCFAGLLDSTGARQGVTANLNTTWNSTGYYEHALTSPFSAPAGTYYAALLVGSASTIPQFSRSTTGTVVNAGLSAGALRFSTYSSGLSAVPSNVTLASQTATTSATAVSFFVALK